MDGHFSRRAKCFLVNSVLFFHHRLFAPRRVRVEEFSRDNISKGSFVVLNQNAGIDC